MRIKYRLPLFLALISLVVSAQLPSGEKLLQQAIAYHDPHSNWAHFNGSFEVTTKTPTTEDRVSTITMDFDRDLFSLAVEKAEDRYGFQLENKNCHLTVNGSTEISNEDRERLRLSCERAEMYKNYYTYLYGLPMKLKDPGTQIEERVERVTFKGETYLRLKVTYDQEVGQDTWYFYFDPHNFSLKAYQFYHDETKNDGEYILLSGLETKNGIKMPKTRKWYYNKEDQYLATDILN